MSPDGRIETLIPIADGPAKDRPGLASRMFAIRAVLANGERVPVEESVVAHLPFAQMRRLRRADLSGETCDSLVIVAPLAGAFPALMRDLATSLLVHVPQVFVTDWPDTRHVPAQAGAFALSENILETARMIRAAGPRCHVVGVCQGVIPALAASLLLAEEEAAPASLSLLGGPVDAACNPTALDAALAGQAEAELERLCEPVPRPFAGAGRRVFPRRRQMQAFALYLWRQAIQGGDLPRQLMLDEGSDPLLFPLARLCWDMMDVPAEFFLANVDQVFRRRALMAGTLQAGGRRVRPQALTRTALLTVEAERDDISAPGQTRAAHALCTGVPDALRRHVLVPGGGHFSLFYGWAMRSHVVPAITDIMAAARTS